MVRGRELTLALGISGGAAFSVGAAVGLYLLALVPAAPGWLLWVLGIGIGFLLIFGFAAWSSVPGRVAGIAHEHVGTAVGLMLTIAAVGGFVVPLGFGVVAERAGFGLVWVFLAARDAGVRADRRRRQERGARPGTGGRPGRGLTWCDQRVSGWVVVGGLAAAAWVWLLACHGRFWLTDQRLPPPVEPASWPSVAVVVPARDEASVLPASLPTLLAQRYPGRARVILVDDGSADGTAELARRLATEVGGIRLSTTCPGEPPEGWTGKLWALAHGATEATDVEYLLFTDADIAHGPGSLARLVAAATGGWDLVSLMATLRTRTGWERLLVPAFVYFFAMLYPFRWVNRPTARTAAAAGGCVLVRREMLARAGGLAAIRDALIDDVALARLVKRAGGRTWLGLAEEVRSVRPYPRLADLWHMVARSAYTQLRHSPPLLAGTALGLALVFIAPPAVAVVGASTGQVPALLAGGAAWLAMSVSYVPMLRFYGRPLLTAPLLPVTALLYAAMTVDSARRHWIGRGATWKGRGYPS